MRSRHRWLVAGLLLLAAGCSTVGAEDASNRSADPVATGQWPGWGFTHTQFSVDVGAPEAVTAARRSLEGTRLVQVQALMGWGAENPEPTPDEYDFDSLDRRIAFIEASGGIPVITLCCAPDWMKGGTPGETDWGDLETAPLPEHYADFAELAAVVAERYPGVRHYMVWNEFKGFFDDERGRWDVEAYTDLYDQVHAALKGVDPGIRVGGPYLDMAAAPEGVDDRSTLSGTWGSVDQRTLDAFEFWLANADGADFVVVDGHATALPGSDPVAALEKFPAVTAWMAARTDLPVWWAEWYVDPAAQEWPPEQQRAVHVAAMLQFAAGGADTVLFWSPRPAADGCATCLWTDPWQDAGGRAQPLLVDVLQPLARWFPPGTSVERLPAPPGVIALAQPSVAVAVNTTAAPAPVSVDGSTTTVGPFETRWLPRG
jgi:hypothetical protein